MAGSYSLYQGNCPRSVSKDAKYVIRSDKGKGVVAVTYMATNEERWLATTEEHPDLVRIVNDIKIGVGGSPNGPFYVNEHGQVIVPVGQDASYYLADEEYDMPYGSSSRETSSVAKASTCRENRLHRRSMDRAASWYPVHTRSRCG